MKRRKPEGFCTHGKENTMSNHPHDEQQPQELRQSLLSGLEANQQEMSELNDEALEQAVGSRRPTSSRWSQRASPGRMRFPEPPAKLHMREQRELLEPCPSR